ncbi:MAG TPA: tetratricopeptide repeat protein, partial [Thermoanaerobaculia bacterium]|nr:tetratricopeptide repeat protein [Thermoanaerobaculia bacterium]
MAPSRRALWLLLALAGVAGASGARAASFSEPPAARPRDPAPSSSSAAGAFVLSRLLAEEGRLAEARVALEEAIALAPDEPYLRAEAARFLLRLGRLGEAGRQAEEARRLAPDSAEILRVAGQVNMNLLERDPEAAARAVAAFEGLRRSRPGDLEALVSLGQLYLGAGRPGDAAEALREAARHHPRQPMVLALLAESARQAEDVDGAIAALGELLLLDPARPALRLQLADLLRERRRFREALEALEGLAQTDRLQPEVGMRLALARYQAGDLERGAEELEQLLAVAPAVPRGHDLLVLLRLADGRPAEAVKPALAAAAGAPEDADLDLQAARVLALAGRHAEASERLAALETRLAASGKIALVAQVSLEHVDLLQRADRREEALARLRALPADAPEEVRAAARLAEIDLLVGLERHDEALALLPAAAPGPAERARRAAVLLRAGREAEASGILQELA